MVFTSISYLKLYTICSIIKDVVQLKTHNKRSVKFILNEQIKYYTKEGLKLINLVAIALFIIITIILMKYKLVCSVSISGEHIGYVQDKELVEKQINDKLALEGTGNVAYVDCTTPEYSLTFISNNTEVNDDYVIAKIEENTKNAVFKNKELLRNVASERIFTELVKLLMGDNVFSVLTEYKEVIAVIIPELIPTFTCKQNTVWHLFDVYTHTAKTVEMSPKIPEIRLIMLLHDIGKPVAKTTDENGVDHFKGHQKISAEMSAPILKRFKVSNEIFNRVMLIIPIHDIHIGRDKKNIKKWLNKLGEQGMYDLICVKRADKLGQNPKMTGEELSNLEITEKYLNEIIVSKEPYSIKDLKINGFDLINLGYKGKQIGEILNIVLQNVISGELENEKNAELDFVMTQTTIC